MGWFDGIGEGIGNGMLNMGENFLNGGCAVWRECGKIAVSYVKQTPMSQKSAWTTVTGGIFSVSLAVAGSLAVLYFVLGWLKESIDIRNNFTLENMFRFFVRLILTASLITNSLSVVSGITECTTAVVGTMSLSIKDQEFNKVFDELRDSLDDSDSGGWEWIGIGAGGFIAGLIGGMTIIVCSVGLVLSVFSYIFKMLLCIPFAPAAFAGFAGGAQFSQSGIAWLKSFIGYGLEAVVIVLAISISLSMFDGTSLITIGKRDASMVSVILLVCNSVMPMITACSCVKGADVVVRRCLGLG